MDFCFYNFLYLNITKSKRLQKLNKVYFILINNKTIFLYIGIIYAYLTMKLKLNRINEEEKMGSNELKKTLGVSAALSTVVGSVIGAGVFLNHKQSIH